MVGIVWELFCGLECFVGVVGSCKFHLVPIRAADIVLTALSERALWTLLLTVFKRDGCFFTLCMYVLCTCIGICTLYNYCKAVFHWVETRER